LVIEAGMQNAAVVGCLMTTRPRFFFEHDNSGVGMLLQQPVSGGQANNSPADNDDSLTHQVLFRSIVP